MLGLTFSSKLDWGSYIISTAKTASKKIGALIHSMKFFSPEVTLYLYKSTIHPCMEYCCYIWTGAPSCKDDVFWVPVNHVLCLVIDTVSVPNLLVYLNTVYLKRNLISHNCLRIFSFELNILLCSLFLIIII